MSCREFQRSAHMTQCEFWEVGDNVIGRLVRGEILEDVIDRNSMSDGSTQARPVIRHISPQSKW